MEFPFHFQSAEKVQESVWLYIGQTLGKLWFLWVEPSVPSHGVAKLPKGIQEPDVNLAQHEPDSGNKLN